MPQFIKSDGASLAYLDKGEGSPIVLLHAFALGKWMWEEQLTHFSQKRRVIAFDWRGFGESSPVENIVTMDDLANDLLSVIHGLNLGNITLAGLSMGGYAVFAFARKYPDVFSAKVSGLILADTKAGIEDENGRLARLEMAALAESAGSGTIAELSVPKWLSPLTKTTKPEVVEKVTEEISRTSKYSIAAAQRGMSQRPESFETLKKILCPTLLIAGSEDILTPPSEARSMAEHLPNPELEIIQGAGHLSNLEAPEAFNAVVTKWLENTKQ